MNKTKYDRKLLTNKLNHMLNIELIQSRVIEQQPNILHNSIINDLNVDHLDAHSKRNKTQQNIIEDRQRRKSNHYPTNKYHQQQMLSSFIQPTSNFYKNKIQLIDTLKRQSITNHKILNKTHIQSYVTHQPNSKINHQEIDPPNKLQGKFNKSIVIKMQNYLLSKMPICQVCASPLNTITKYYQLQCGNCRRYFNYRQSSQKFPLLGILYQVQNNNNDQQWCIESIKEIQKEIKRLQDYILKLQILRKKLQTIQHLKKHTTQPLKTGKIQLYNLLKEQNITKSNLLNTKVIIESKLQMIIPNSFIQQLNVWSSINLDQFKNLPLTYNSLNNNFPICFKKPQPNILPYLQTLTNNFQNQLLTLRVSNQTIQFPTISLNNVKLIVDGPYKITKFQHIKTLEIELEGRRTYKELQQLIQNIPQTVEEIIMKYDCRINASTEQYPILLKICSLKMCKKLYLEISNIKNEDLLEVSKILTKKKDLTIIINGNYSSSIVSKNIQLYKFNIKSQQEKDDQILINNILKKVGKGVMKLHLKIPLTINRQKLFMNIVLGGYYKLYSVKISTNNDGYCGYYQNIMNRIIAKKQMIVYLLTKHTNKYILNKNKQVRQAVLGILLGD